MPPPRMSKPYNHMNRAPKDTHQPASQMKGQGKKKKKKNATQQPAFIARPIQVLTKTGPLPQPRGPMANQPCPPALQSFQAVPSFQAPHQQQETLVDLTDDKAPETPLATGGWKPVASANETPQGISPNNTWDQRKREMYIKHQQNRVKKKFGWINTTKLETIDPSATTRDQQGQGQKEIKWEINLVDDSDDNKPAGSTLNQGNDPPIVDITIPKPQCQAPVQGTPDAKPIVPEKQEPEVAIYKPPTTTEDAPVTTKPTGPVQQTVPAVKPQPQPSVPPQPQKPKAKVVEKHMPMRVRAMMGHRAGIPRSFLTAQHVAGLYAAVEPQASTATARTGPNWILNPTPHEPPATAPVYVQTSVPTETTPPAPSPPPQQYSPSDVYDDSIVLEQDPDEGSDSQAAQKRLSAFQRLGPATQPKKPKLTINILYNKDQEGRNQAVREVVDETEPDEKYIPVHLRPDVVESTDETVARYLPLWPWKRTLQPRKSVTHRTSKSVMILEQEQMEEAYDKEHAFFQVSVRGYPKHWRKENILDVMLDSVRGKSFVPCFIELSTKECKFLIIRCRSALTAIHKLGFYIRKDDIELAVTISQLDLTLNHVDFVPRLVLRKRLAMVYDGERKLNLKKFTLKPDISNFIYFPLNRLTNQTELVQLQSTVAWAYLTDLDLSHNRLTSLDGFDLSKTTPKLKHLDISSNHIERVTTLLRCRDLALRSLKLEGNPLCHDYTDPAHYVRVIKMIFPGLVEIDGLPLRQKGDMPEFRRNYSPEYGRAVAERFLEVFFPLLDLPIEERLRIEDLYDEKAVLTITYRYSLRYSPFHRYFRNLFLRSRTFEDGETDAVEGAAAIAKLVAKWPHLQHDPYALTADVMHHSETHTILRVGGILKLTSESLAEDEHLLAFTRTLVLVTTNGAEYKIRNEMLYWDDATRECGYNAFQINSVRLKKLSLKFELTPDTDLQEKIVEIFMKLTDLEKSASIRCLELKEWNLKTALEHFVKLLKLNDLESLRTQE